MALSYVDQGGAVATSATASPAYPTTVLANDVLMFSVSSNSSSIPTTLSGWTPDPAGVVTAGGISTMAFYKIAAGGESGTVTLSGITGGTKGWAGIIRARSNVSGTGFDFAWNAGTDTAATSTAYAADGASWALQSGDLIVGAYTGHTTANTYSASASGQTIAQAGATVTSTARFGGLTGTNTVSYGCVTAAVTGSGTGAPTLTATMPTASGATAAGVTRFLRVREVPAGPIIADAGSEPVGATDAATAALSALRSQSEPVGVTDDAGSVLAAVRGQSDAVGLADAVTAVLSSVRAISDAVTVTDLPGPQVLDVALGVDDPTGVSDVVAQLMAAARTIADAAGITDSVTVVLDRAIAAADPLGVSDTVAQLITAARTIADPVGVGDAVTATRDAATTATDPVGVADAVSVESGRGTNDPAAVSDQVAVTLTLGLDAADAVGISDSVTATISGAGNASVADMVAASDVVSVTVDATRPASDAVGVLDAVTAILTRAASTDDPVGAADSASAVQASQRATSDPVGVADVVGVASVTVRTVGDGLAVTDTVTAVLSAADIDTPAGRTLKVMFESRVLAVPYESSTYRGGRMEIMTHDPNAVLDYRWDWKAPDWQGRDWLGDDTIASATVVGEGVTVDDDGQPAVTWDDTTVTAWASGGTIGTRAKLVCHITTAAGRQDDRTIHLAVRNR